MVVFREFGGVRKLRRPPRIPEDLRTRCAARLQGRPLRVWRLAPGACRVASIVCKNFIWSVSKSTRNQVTVNVDEHLRNIDEHRAKRKMIENLRTIAILRTSMNSDVKLSKMERDAHRRKINENPVATEILGGASGQLTAACVGFVGSGERSAPAIR